MIKHHNYRQPGKESVRLAHSCCSLREVGSGTWRKELTQKPWRNPTYSLACYGLLSLLSYTCQDNLSSGGNPEAYTPWAWPDQGNTPHNHLHPIWGRHFLNWGLYSQIIVACAKWTTQWPQHPCFQKLTQTQKRSTLKTVNLLNGRAGTKSRLTQSCSPSFQIFTQLLASKKSEEIMERSWLPCDAL